jgi:hypothetical protein
MAWFLFIDESGQDHKDSPYEVLAGVAIKDEILWDLIKELHDAEHSHFGRRYSEGDNREIKGKKLIKRKTFTKAAINLNSPLLPNETPLLAKQILDDGGVSSSLRHQKALALAKIAYVTDVFSICQNYGCKVFASIVDQDAPESVSGGLRKDYGYLFQRFFYFLEDMGAPQGVLVFDELEKSKSHIFIDQAHRYFKDTQTGRHRASLVIPEPFFVHSDLTTGIQIADLVAYCLSWGYRLPGMTKPARGELAPYITQIRSMQREAVRSVRGNDNFVVYGICHIADLRTAMERIDD